jgi:hypothetical protein
MMEKRTPECHLAAALLAWCILSLSVLHLCEPQGVDWPPALAWGPDGKWITLSDGSLSDDAGLWVARTDGQGEEYHLGRGGNPVWSPDGN